MLIGRCLGVAGGVRDDRTLAVRHLPSPCQGALFTSPCVQGRGHPGRPGTGRQSAPLLRVPSDP